MIASSADLFGLEAKINELMSVTGAELALQHDRIERKLHVTIFVSKMTYTDSINN